MFGHQKTPEQQQFTAHLNQVCRQHNPLYSAMQVSWNDNSRQQGSCYGNNITDARLKGKDGEDFLVVRPQNFNEKIGKVKASDVALIVGNHCRELKPQTLEHVLKNFGVYSDYATTEPAAGVSLYDASRDEEIGIRFQAVFIPVPATPGGNGTREFYPDTYNYQTRSASDPRNVILLANSQGTFVQQDGCGSQPQYVHEQKQVGGKWTSHYLEASMTTHSVALTQTETAQEREAALAANKAVSTVIGIRSMGLGFNRLMTIQIPLCQQPRPHRTWDNGIEKCMNFSGGGEGCQGGYSSSNSFASSSAPPSSPVPFSFGGGGGNSFSYAPRCRSSSKSSSAAFSARVSSGSIKGDMKQLAIAPSKMKRDPNCAITITVQFYFAFEMGTLIKEEDIQRAVDVCEEAYRGCSFTGHLMSTSKDLEFAKSSEGCYAPPPQQQPHFRTTMTGTSEWPGQ